jgi:hypothetical protein
MARSVVPLFRELSIRTVWLEAHLSNHESAVTDAIARSPLTSDYSCVDFSKRPKHLIGPLRTGSSVPSNCVETVNPEPGVAV